MTVTSGVASRNVRSVAREAGYMCREKYQPLAFLEMQGMVLWGMGMGMDDSTYDDFLPYEARFLGLFHSGLRFRFGFDSEDAGFRDGETEDAVEDLQGCDWEEEF